MTSTSQMVELLKAVREHSGMELQQIRQAGLHGADAGWSGFTYTSDGSEFFRNNDEVILELLVEDANQFGHANVPEFVGTFGRADMADTRDGYECLLAWYALETVGRWLTDSRDARRDARRYS